MREIGVEISDRTPKLLTLQLAEQADLIVTMGCGDQCPVIPEKRYVDCELPDPAGQSLDMARALRARSGGALASSWLRSTPWKRRALSRGGPNLPQNASGAVGSRGR